MKNILTPYECLLIYLGDYSKEQQYASSLLLKMYFKNNFHKLMNLIKDETPFAINDRNSSKAKIWKKKVKQKANYTCDKCGSKDNLVAHHKIEWIYSINGRFDLDNGQCLCDKCHKKEHNDLFQLNRLENIYG